MGWIAAFVVNDDESRQQRVAVGAARETAAAPIEPLAPGRLSTITGIFHSVRQALAQHPRERVVRSARRIGHDELDQPRGIGRGGSLRQRGPAGEPQHQQPATPA